MNASHVPHLGLLPSKHTLDQKGVVRLSLDGTSVLKRSNKHEADMLQNVQGCPGVVSLNTCTSHGKDMVLIMDHLEGGILTPATFNLDVHGPPMVETIRTIWDRGICHRDLAPHNWIMHQGRYVLIDFGLACPVSQLKKAGFYGTPEFASLAMHDVDLMLTVELELEALGYLFEWCLRGGKLPWTGKDKEQMHWIKAQYELSPQIRRLLDK